MMITMKFDYDLYRQVQRHGFMFHHSTVSESPHGGLDLPLLWVLITFQTPLNGTWKPAQTRL